MSDPTIAVIFFFYGLAFYSMGLPIVLELGRASDMRMRHALIPVAGFAFLHGAHEWFEMFELLQVIPCEGVARCLFSGIRIALLAWSFMGLAAFGASLLAPNERARRLSLLVPVAQSAIWAFGLLTIQGRAIPGKELWDAADVWTRYTVGVPGALLACGGLLVQQRVFRRAGLIRFGRDSLWAAVAFAWYGVVGQMFTRPSILWPSTILNQDLFIQTFRFPVQILRATAALVAAIFIIRTLRSFEVERQRQIAELQVARLEEAERRERLGRAMLRRIVAAQEAERKRIARELHDETGQTLTAIGMALRGVATTVRQHAKGAAEQLRQLEGLVILSLDDLQRVIADLRPSHLDDLGLPAALRWYADSIQERVPVKVEVNIHGDPRPLLSPVKTAIFRIAQEAITNVAKHADASKAQVDLFFDEDQIRLLVRDDGRGFDLENLKRSGRSTWGLLGMEERATLLDGEMRLISAPGRGTTVEVILPYHQEKGGDDEDPLAASG